MSDSIPHDPLGQAIAQSRTAAEGGDIASAVTAQEQVVMLTRKQGNGLDALQMLFVQLANLANFYGAAERFKDAVRVLEEAVIVGERIKHPQIDAVRQMLESARRAATLTPTQIAELKARQQHAEQEDVATEAELKAQLDALPPEQRAQMEEALRQFQNMTPEQQAAVVAQAQRAEIQSLADQVRDAAIAVRRGQAPREQLLPQMEQLAAQIEQNEKDSPPWMELAAFVRAVVVLLRGRTSLILIPGRAEEPPPPVPPAFAAHMAAIQKG